MIETVCENQWLSLKKVVEPEMGISGYMFSHESRCNGKIIAALPYRTTNYDNHFEVLIRKEITPCWGLDYNLSSITGGWEGGDPRDTTVLEVKEEAGYEIEKQELISLGTCFGTKSTDSIYYLYSVDLTGKEQGEAPGDGSSLDTDGSVLWVSPETLLNVSDPTTSVMLMRLMSHLGHIAL